MDQNQNEGGLDTLLNSKQGSPQEGLEAKTAQVSSNKNALKEYGIVFLATESLGFVGVFVGSHVTPLLTKSYGLITSGVLSGDFIGGTMGQLGSYWYNNKEKFRDEEGNKKYAQIIKDFSKVIVYDIPVTAMAYGITSYITYHMVKWGMDKTAIAAISSVFIISTWNITNFFVYNMIKHNADEKVVGSICCKIKDRMHSVATYFSRKNSEN